MFGDMMGKLQEMQQKTEEVKNRLDTISVDAEVQGVKVIVNGNKKVTAIKISEEIAKAGDAEQIEDLTLAAINRAMEKAEKVYESEMQHIAKGMLPGMG